MTNDEIRIAIAQHLYPEFPVRRENGELRHLYPHRGPHETGPMENYTSDANAVLELCDKLAEEGWGCDLSMGADKTWECTFERPSDDNTRDENLSVPETGGCMMERHYHAEDSLPLAISIAFLKTKGLWDSGKEGGE